MVHQQNREKIYANLYAAIGHLDDYTKFDAAVDYVLKVAEGCYRKGVDDGQYNVIHFEESLSELEIMFNLKRYGILPDKTQNDDRTTV